MTALAAERSTAEMATEQGARLNYKIDGGSKPYKHSLCVLNSLGYLEPGTSAPSKLAVGRCTKTVDNTAGADGALSVEVEEGIFKWANAGSTDACTQAEVGSDVYVYDDQTVTKTATGRSKAGKMVALDADGGVWVRTSLGNAGGFATPVVQQTTGTLVSGTATIATGITVTANTRCYAVPTGNITGSTNFGCLAHVFASNVAGAPGTGSIVIAARGSDGLIDSDAAGAFQVLLVG